jgi:hypothetical protein
MTPQAEQILQNLTEYQGSDKILLLENTIYQTPAFIFDSGESGMTILILGGTHGDEPAGYETALRIVASLDTNPPQKGKVIIIPLANRQAVNNFNRRIPVPQDEEIERGNLNRCYPGKTDGLPMEQLAYQIQRLTIENDVDVFLDLHEARYLHLDTPPESDREKGLGQTLIYYPNEASAWVLMNLLDQINATIADPDEKFSGLERPILNSASWWAGKELNIAAFTFETSRSLDLDKRIDQHTQLVNIVFRLYEIR